jgi:RNA polymerase sigma factor (sigma-70 family)
MRDRTPQSDCGQPTANAELLRKAQHYLSKRQSDRHVSQESDGEWSAFYEAYQPKIRAFARACGVSENDLVDCVQDVWRELLVRLPAFRFDPHRGQFDSWLFSVVQSKAADQLRGRKRLVLLADPNAVQAVGVATDTDRTDEAKRLLDRIWGRAAAVLSDSSLLIIQMRLLERRPVAEVAEQLGITREQVWYRYHRARRKLREIGAVLTGDPIPGNSLTEKKKQECAQGSGAPSVSQSITFGARARRGESCVDYVFQRVELGRRDLSAEWKVEWDCADSPRPVLYIRKLAIVAYAEICGPAEFINAHWPAIVNAAVTAGVAAGIATIIATPTAALPILQSEFQKHLKGRGGREAEDRLHIALSARQEPNGPWCACKE